jgi:hypothetical protein
MTDWLPIESAPKDYWTDILVWAGGNVTLSSWEDGKDTGFPEGWIDHRADDGVYISPTHWMPLPAPPGVETGIPIHPTELATRGIKGLAVVKDVGDE